MFLAKAGIPCTVIDKATFPRDKICGDAISGKVIEVLDDIDSAIVHRLMREPVQLDSHGVTFVAPNLKSLRVPFKSPEESVSTTPPGFVSRRMDFDHFLVREMQLMPKVTLLQGVEASSYSRDNETWIIRNKSGEVICEARLLLVADGAQSRFTRHVAGEAMNPRHHSGAVRGYYRGVTGMDEENFIELHFLKPLLPGYFWIFPLPNGWANVGAGMRSDVIGRKRINLKQAVHDIIQSTPQLKSRFSKATLHGELQGFGLPLGSAKRRFSGDGYMLLGDAASLIDPFTGEGIGNAVVSARLAASVTERALTAGNLGASFLTQYDDAISKTLRKELTLSGRLQALIRYPWLFNMVVNKASRNAWLRDTISLMYEDVDLRKKLKQPGFYLKLLFS